MTSTMDDEFQKISNSVGAAISILSRTLGLYEKVRDGQKLAPQDVSGILNDVRGKQKELEWAYDQLKEVSKNPFHLKFIKIHSEQHSTQMAINLLSAMAKTSPGKPFPSATEMAKTLDIQEPKNRDKFVKGYGDAAAQIEASQASAQTQSFNIWYWICMSMFGTFAFVIALWMARKFYEMVMNVRKRVADFVMPKRPLSNFKFFTFVRKHKRKFWPVMVPLAGPPMDESDSP